MCEIRGEVCWSAGQLTVRGLDFAGSGLLLCACNHIITSLFSALLL